MDVDDFKQSPKNPLIVVLDNVRSMLNVGSVFRTSDAFRIQRIYLCGITPKPPHRDITKSALGADLAVDWTYEESTISVVNYLQQQGYMVYAIEQVENSISLQSFTSQPDKRIAIVMGHEVNGVDQAVVDVCDGSIEIPQYGTKHSLNISVCAGIVLWELVGKYELAQS